MTENELNLQRTVSRISRQIGTEINCQTKEYHDTAEQLDQAMTTLLQKQQAQKNPLSRVGFR